MEDITQKLTPRQRPTVTNEFRMATMEKHNQLKALSSANNRVSMDFVLGTITYRDEDGNITRVSDGKKDTFYDKSGKITRIISGTTDTVYDSLGNSSILIENT